MKKNFLWTMAAALALVGCSETELLDTPQALEQNAITFDTYVGDNAQTRAAVIDRDVLGVKGFGVNAYYTKTDDYATASTNKTAEVFMKNTKVTLNPDKGTTGVWEYSPVKYWPNNEGDKVSFFAYGPFANNGNANNIDLQGTDINFTVNNDVKQQVDLVYNTNYAGTINQVKQAVNERIHFQFGHALARIAFTVEAAVDETTAGDNLLDGNTRINVKKVALVGNAGYDEANPTGPFYTGGTLSLLDPSTADDGTPNSPWSNTVGTQGFVFNATDHFYHTVKDTDAETNDEIDVVQLTRFNASEPQRLLNDDSYLMIIPQEDTKFKIYIEYDVISGGYENNGDGVYDESAIVNKITSTEALKVNFEKGKAYNFNLVLGMTSVKFEVDEVTEWDEQPSEDEWLPENKDDELVATNLVYDATVQSILIRNAADLVEARDFINSKAVYQISSETIEGDYIKIYQVKPLESSEKVYDKFQEASYLQTGEVDLADYDNWTPIGLDEDRSFDGFYNVSTDGTQELCVKNLKITSCSTGYAGLFGYATGNITNVRLQNVNVGTDQSAVSSEYVGALAGACLGEVKSCKVESGNVYGSKNAASLVAYGTNTLFYSCSNAATVSGAENVAGIYAGSAGLIEDCENSGIITSTSGKAAGIAIATDHITNARNSGNISGNGDTGGIVAEMNSHTGVVIASYNTGTITSKAGYAGGIVGSGYHKEITACYNTASSISGHSAGGIIGFFSVEDPNKTWSATMTACYSTTSSISSGQANESMDAGSAGALCGIVGTSDDDTITYNACYYNDYDGNAIGSGVEQMPSGITKIDETNNTWDTAMQAMNSALSGWAYSGTADAPKISSSDQTQE